MKTQTTLLAIALLAAAHLHAAPKPWEPAIAALSADRLMADTRTLSSDAFEGRGPGTPGEDKAVAFMEAGMRAAGLEPGGAGGTWTQDVPIVGITSEVTLSVGPAGAPKPMAFPSDFVAWSPRTDATVSGAPTGIVFVGHGVTAPEYQWDDFKGVDVRGKTLLILVNDPQVPDPRDPAKLDARVFGGNAMTYYGRWTYKFEEAARRGAAAAIIIHETKAAAYPWFVVVNSWGREQFALAGSTEPTVPLAGWMHLDAARRLLEANGLTYEKAVQAAARRDFRPMELRERLGFESRQAVRRVRSRNVLGALRGSDARLRDEWVVYTAHWDHLGKNPKLDGDGIFNGAADNAVGAAGLLELARGFASAPRRPARSVLFLSTTAEEQGLLGARHYAAHPAHPIARTAANINIDGLNHWGRTTDLHQIGRGASSLDDVLSAVAASRGRALLPDAHPERGSFYRSDHFEFMRKGVPALYTSQGLRFVGRPEGWGDAKVGEWIDRHYHKPSDEIGPDWELSGAVDDLGVLLECGWRVADARRMPAWRPGGEFHR